MRALKFFSRFRFRSARELAGHDFVLRGHGRGKRVRLISVLRVTDVGGFLRMLCQEGRRKFHMVVPATRRYFAMAWSSI